MCCPHSLICPRGLVLWVLKHTAMPLFRASQITALVWQLHPYILVSPFHSLNSPSLPLPS